MAPVSSQGQKISFTFNTSDNSYPLIFLKLVKETPETEAHSPDGASSDSKALAIPAEKLTASPFFAALLERWASK